MRGYGGWSHRPYVPACEAGERERPVICRLAPGRDALAFEWRCADAPDTVRAAYAPLGSGRWTHIDLAGVLSDIGAPCARIEGLMPDTEYELYVETRRGARSRVRRFRTGEFPGTVINYLHPEDDQYAFSGRYLCSPSLLMLPGGALLASMDVYGPAMPQNLTLLFRSEDGGASWRYLTELFPCFWGKLFRHGGALYMLGVSNEYGDLLIGRSDDEGRTWGVPTVLQRGSACTREYGNHRAPVVLLRSAGRLWTGVEYGTWHKKRFADALLSIDARDDLLDAANWALTPYLDCDARWPGAAEGVCGAIEGNVVESPEGDVLEFLRYAPGKALVLRADASRPEAPLRFERIQPFPLAHTKFEIQRHENGWYYAVGNELPARTVLAVYRSRDLREWRHHADVVNRAGEDAGAVGFQYPSFVFAGEDMLIMSRTACNGAHNFHDSNCMTLHRVRVQP